MNKLKPMCVELDGEKKEFKSRKECIEFIKNTYNLGDTTIRMIISSKKPYIPRQRALYSLAGLKIYHI